MSTPDDAPVSRPGSGADLSRRMDQMERNHADLAKEVNSLAGTVALVVANQNHAAELNKLRFDALDTSVKASADKLGSFIDRVNGIISGEVKLPANEARIADWNQWRGNVDDKMEKSEGKLDEQAVLNGQVRLLGRLAVLLVTSNILALAAAIYSVVTATQKVIP